MQSVLVLGGGSDIALATVRAAGRSGARRTVVLAGARPRGSSSRSRRADLAAARRRRTVETVAFDAAATDTHDAFVDDVFDRFGDIDLVAPRVRRARRPGPRPSTTPTPRSTSRGSNYVGAVSVAVPVVAAPAHAGPRDDRGAVVGGGRARPPVELRLRLVEGRASTRSSRASATASSAPGVHGDDRATRVRAHEDDRGPGRRRRSSTTPEAVADAIVHGLARGRRPSGCPARCAT